MHLSKLPLKADRACDSRGSYVFSYLSSRNLLPGQNSLPLPLARATIPLPRSGDCERGGQVTFPVLLKSQKFARLRCRDRLRLTTKWSAEVYRYGGVSQIPSPCRESECHRFSTQWARPRRSQKALVKLLELHQRVLRYRLLHTANTLPFFGGFTQTTRYADSLIGGWQISLKSDVSQDPSGLAFLVLLEATSNNRASEKVFFISPARHFPFRLSFPFLGELHFLAARNFQPRKWLTQPMCHLERRSGQEAMTACRQDFIPPASSRCSGWARGTVLWNSVVALEIGSAVALQ
ncbi:conserved hypothetical protein [Coccidioides posadasii str. Silveira]|uniref:Uncharacterized protein n=1 Tax=Coccidioides posadasii (strain RMSCC 757 / Silveira) TaxID=443226 RepID=E9CT73_COCPS|nr:conserved hypothetical protein [Coccidioides posadasii str. Silveira]